MRELRRLATVDVSPLRHRDFRLLFWGQLISMLGSQITYVAVPYQVYSMTHSPLLVGVLGVVEVVPVLALSMVGGLIADHGERRTIVLTTELAFAVLSTLLLVNALLPEPQLAAIYALAGLQAGLFALQRPSLEALTPRLVERAELTAAGALTALRGTVGMVAGPAVGGTLIVLIGLPATFAADVVSFVFSLVALWLMRATPPALEQEHPSWRGVLEGLQFARERPELLGTYIVDMVVMFFGIPQALFPAIVEDLGSPTVLGLLYSAPAVGALALGNAESGLMAAAFGVPFAVVSGGVLCVIGCLVCAGWMPTFRAYSPRVVQGEAA